MTTARRPLASRRFAETFTFKHASDRGLQPSSYTATVGRYPTGEIGEVFLNSAKIGSGADSAARDAAIAVSIALQHGVPLALLRHAVTRNSDGSPSSPIGRLLDLLEGGEPPEPQPRTPTPALESADA